MSKIILSRVPFRISLGGGSTDLPSYYEKYGGFIFAATVNLYMDILIKSTRSDDLIHVHYKNFEAVPTVELVQHELAREVLRKFDIHKGISISFKADTPAGTGLGSSGACTVALVKGAAIYTQTEIDNDKAAATAFSVTRSLGLPDGVQDPYTCALGGFVVLDINQKGEINISQPEIESQTIERFFANTLFLYTGIQRYSAPLLANQDQARVLELKHQTKAIGVKILKCFLDGDLDQFGNLMDEHWNIKKQMSVQMTNPVFDRMYDAAISNGALGGKIMGAGAGGYFMFYCPDQKSKQAVIEALSIFKMREMALLPDYTGARTKVIDI